MSTPNADKGSPDRRARDEQIAAEPPLAPLDLPSDAVATPMDSHLDRQRPSLVVELLKRLHDLRELCPEMRLGQMLATVVLLAEDETGQSLWEVEDADFAAALERFTADMTRRRVDSGR